MRFDFLCRTQGISPVAVVIEALVLVANLSAIFCVIAWVELHPYRRTFRDDRSLMQSPRAFADIPFLRPVVIALETTTRTTRASVA